MKKRSASDISIEVLSAINHRDFSVVEVDLVVGGSRVLDDENQPIVGLGIARRDPIDKANPELGFDLAVARALVSLGTHALRRVNGRVKQLDDLAENQIEKWAAEHAARIVGNLGPAKRAKKKGAKKVKAKA